MGWPDRYIAKKINVHCTTVSCTLKQICQFGTVYYVTPGHGPKSTFPDCELWQMQQFIQSSAAQDGADVHHLLDKLVHPATICYKLCKIGLYGCVCHMVPLRTQKTMKRRWQWVTKVREHDCRSRTTSL